MPMPAKKGKVPEELVAQIWKGQWVKQEGLLTSDGKGIEIIHPGKERDDYGPDFGEAILWVEEKGLLQGDVEIHVRSSQWQAHGHHLDPRYNAVVLHVVMWDDRGYIYLQNGEKVPVLALLPYLILPLEKLQSLLELPLAQPCRKASGHNPGAIAELVDRAGEERFLSKADRFKSELAIRKEEQVLYEGIMGALGYARNKQPFQELARRLPMSLLPSLAEARTTLGYSFKLQALFLGMSGLLPEQRYLRKAEEERIASELSRVWRSFGISETMTEAAWRFLKVRPGNFPPRRLVAASYLLARYKEEGLLGGMLRLVNRERKQAFKEMELGLLVESDDYWASHFDFGVEAVRKPNLIGRARAREIVVNILLPFFLAWAELTSQLSLKVRVLELYHSYPRMEENRVTRYTGRRIFGPDGLKKINLARRQQGLIHLYNTFCSEQRCADCPLVRIHM